MEIQFVYIKQPVNLDDVIANAIYFANKHGLEGTKIDSLKDIYENNQQDSVLLLFNCHKTNAKEEVIIAENKRLREVLSNLRTPMLQAEMTKIDRDKIIDIIENALDYDNKEGRCLYGS